MDEETQEDVKQVVKGVRGLSGVLALNALGSIMITAGIMIFCILCIVMALASR